MSLVAVFGCARHEMQLLTFINLISLSTVNFFFIIAGIFLNVVVIICVRSSTQFRKGTFMFMILLLSSFDLLVVVVGHPAVILTAVYWSAGENNVLKHRSTTFGSFGHTVAKLTLMASNYAHRYASAAFLTMNIDCYLAVARPLFHRVNVTKGRLFALLLSIQAALTVAEVFRFYPVPKVIQSVATATFGGCFLFAIFIVNYRLFKIVAASRRATPTCKAHLALLKKSYTCVLTVAYFFILVLPSIVYALLGSTVTAIVCEQNFMLIRLWAHSILCTFSTWNCLVFAWRSKTLRGAKKKLLKLS